MVGNRVSGFADTIRRQDKLGMEIGSHSWDHSKLTKLSAAAVAEQKKRTEDALTEITGHGTSLIRPPYGAVNQTVRDTYGMPVILWSVDTLDWKTRDKNSTVNRVMNTVKDGDIILMHDIYQASADAAVELIPKLINEGYTLVTVSELGEARYGGLSNGQKYSSMRQTQ